MSGNPGITSDCTFFNRQTPSAIWNVRLSTQTGKKWVFVSLTGLPNKTFIVVDLIPTSAEFPTICVSGHTHATQFACCPILRQSCIDSQWHPANQSHSYLPAQWQRHQLLFRAPLSAAQEPGRYHWPWLGQPEFAHEHSRGGKRPWINCPRNLTCYKAGNEYLTRYGNSYSLMGAGATTGTPGEMKLLHKSFFG